MSTDTRPASTYVYLVDAVRARATGQIDAGSIAYVTDGGTWILASNPRWNDDGRPHDLIAVLPAPIEGTRVLVLRPNVNPDVVDALRDELDTEDGGQ